MMPGRFVSTHSVVLILPLHLDYIPERGASVRADTATSRPGGGFTTLSAVAGLGIRAVMASPLGTGPNSFTVRQQLVEAGVTIVSDELVGDIGVALLLVEADGSITSVVTSGVESEPSIQALERIPLRPGDLIHIAGADLTNMGGAEILSKWGSRLPDSVTLVVSVSPAVEQVPLAAWERLIRRADVLTMNIREAAALGHMISAQWPGQGIRNLLRPQAALVRRLGVMGCEIQVSEDQPRIQIPAFDSVTIDTAGVGDTHIATMCAALLMDYDLERACRMANAAAAVTLSHEGALPVPTREEIDAVLREGRVIYSS